MVFCSWPKSRIKLIRFEKRRRKHLADKFCVDKMVAVTNWRDFLQKNLSNSRWNLRCWRFGMCEKSKGICQLEGKEISGKFDKRMYYWSQKISFSLLINLHVFQHCKDIFNFSLIFNFLLTHHLFIDSKLLFLEKVRLCGIYIISTKTANWTNMSSDKKWSGF